ncbi:MAG TPA: tripartite tricarboxylate transporter substrate-binding protein, partial [Pseudothermotoga sp.]
LQSGQVRALAIMADERDPRFPDVPTLKELGINWSAGTWRDIAAPKKTPPEIKAILERAILEIANSDAFRSFMNTNGFGIKIRDGAQFYEFVKKQDQDWKHVLELGGDAK